jgi:hypothetical protein
MSGPREVNGMVRRLPLTVRRGYKLRKMRGSMELFTLGIDLGKTTFHLKEIKGQRTYSVKCEEIYTLWQMKVGAGVC